MAKDPQITFIPKFEGISQAMQRVQDVVSRRPLKVALATDTKGLDGLNKGLGKLSGSADEFTKSLEAANARVLAFGASVAVISAIQRGFVNLVKSTVEVEAAFKKISVVGDQFAATAGQLEKFGRGIFDVARQTGQSFDETSKAALEFARQGLGAAETLTRVKDALVLTRLSGLDATSSVEGLTAAVNAFKKEGLSTTDILNKLIAVDNKYAVSSGDLIEAIKRSGSFAQEAGLSFDELGASVTVLQELTARGGSVIGNSLKTIFERVQRPESLRQLKDLGVEIKDVQGNIRPAIVLISDLAQKIGGLKDSERKGVVRQLAGTLQINQLSALINALGEAEGAGRRYDEILQTFGNASIEAATANNKLNETLDAQVKSLLATGTQLGSLFGDIAIAPALKSLISGPLGIAEIGKTLIDGLTSDGPTITKAFASVIGDAILAAGVAGTLSIGLILKKFAIFAKDSFSNILGINSAAKNQQALQLTILNTLRSRSDIEAIILNAGNNQVAQAQVLARLYKNIADQDARRVATSKILSQSLAPGFVVGSTGQPTPRGKRSASGYVPDLIQAEYADIKKGTGGAKKNSGVVLINDFPFGGGKKGPMVANTSEGIMPMGGSAAVLNQDMLDRMGYGKRAAEGFKLPTGLSPQLKSGKFSSQSSVIESAVTDLVQLLVGYGKTALEINNALRSVVSKYDLQKKSLDAVVKAGNQYARTLEIADKNAKQAAQAQFQNTKGGSNASFGAGQRVSAQQASIAAAQKAYIEKLKAGFLTNNKILDNLNVGIGQYKKRLAEIQGTSRNPGLLSSASGPEKARLEAEKAALVANLKASERRKSSTIFQREKGRALLNAYGEVIPSSPSTTISDQQRKAQEELKARLQEKFFGGDSGSGGGSSGSSSGRPPLQSEIDAKKKADIENGLAERLGRTDYEGLSGSVDAAKKTFNEAAIEFGTQSGSIFFGASVLKEGLTLLGLEMSNTVDTIRDVAIAYIGIKKLSEVGGFSTEDLSEGLSTFGERVGTFVRERIPGAGAVSRGVGTAISGIGRFGSRIIGLLPVFGQLAAGVFAANSVLSYFGIDAWASIKQFVTGLSAEGEKARDSLKTFSESLFENGKFVGKTREDISRDLSSSLQQERTATQAKLRGIKTEGRDPNEVSADVFRGEIERILAKQKIGGRTEITREQFLPSGVGGVSRVQVGTREFRDKTLADAPKEVQAVLNEIFGKIGSLTTKELSDFAKDKKIETSAKDSAEQLREKVIEAVFQATIGPDALNLSTGGKEAIQGRVLKAFQPKSSTRDEIKARNPELFTDVNTVRAQVSAALELKKLQLDFSTESERVLETKIKTAQISDIELTNLQTVLDGLKLERALRGDIFDIASKGIDKLTGDEGFSDLEKTNLKASIEGITRLGLGVKETKDEVVKILDVLGGDVVTENIKKEILGQLDGVEKINKKKTEQLKIQNDQLKNEARITEQIRQQQSLADLSFSSRSSSVDSAKSRLEGRIGIFNAQANNPNLNSSQQDAAKRTEISAQIELLRLSEQEAQINKEKARNALSLDKNLGIGERAVKSTLITDEYNKSTQAISDQITALRIQEGLIGASASAMTLLANAAYQFKQNLGEIESSNILSTLRATDFSSLGSSLSSQQAFSDLGSSGKTGLDAEQFLAERTALRQKEFEIASATSKVQKLQLTQEKQLLEDIFAAKKSGLAPDEAIARLIELQNKRLKEQRSLRSGVNSATAEIKDEIDQFGSEFGRTATFGFRDSLSEALKAAANGTGDLKNALLDVALSFANKLRDAALDNLANIATNALFGSGGGSGGGNIVSGVLSGIGGLFKPKGYASGGKITGGSGTKDDVPILGMGGEFMINKKSVQKYGPQLFEALNQGRLQKMASGGLVDPGMSGKSIRGSKNLLDFASQSFTSGAGDKILNLGGGAASVELEPESLRLTNFARQSGNPLQSATKEAKDQALSLVFQDQELRKQYKDQIDALKKAEKEKQKQLLVSLAVAAIGAGVGSAFSGKGSVPGGEGSLYGQYQLPTYGADGRYLGMTADNARISSGLSNRTVISSTSSASNVSAGVTRALSSSSAVGLSELYRPNQVGSYNGIIPSLRASGGPVGGNGYGDNVPAMLSGGEFVMNRKAAKNLGLANLSAANSGQSMGLSEEKSEELNEKLIAKLDELVEKMSGGNNVTVNVSMDKEGKTSTSETGQQNEDQKNMNRRIKDAVVQILQEEKRLGGVLRK